MTAETIYRLMSIAFLTLGLFAIVRARIMLNKAEVENLEAKRRHDDATLMGTIIPESYCYIEFHEAIRVIAEHGTEVSVVKSIPYDSKDPEDRAFAIREAKELIRILKRDVI